jgi:hypothetical protein
MAATGSSLQGILSKWEDRSTCCTQNGSCHFQAIAKIYSNRPKKQIYEDLFVAASRSGVCVLDGQPSYEDYSQIVDAIFGFSFDPSGGIRAPFDEIINGLARTEQECSIIKNNKIMKRGYQTP